MKLAVLAVAALLAGCAPPAQASTCPDPTPSTAAGFRVQLDDLDDAEWAGGDQATTVLLPDGRSVWLFGDTLGPGYFDHNSIIIQDDGCLEVIRPAIPDNADGSFYWPSHGVVDGGELLVFVSRVTSGGGGFAVNGTEIARFSLPGLDYLGKAPTPSVNRPDTGVHWGASVVRSGSYVYVYGNQKVVGPWIFGKAGYLARVPAGKLTQLNKWRYWAGSSWADVESAAVKILDENVHGMSTNWSTHRDGDDWVIVHKKFDVFGDEIVSLRSANPWGPWTEKHLMDTPPWSEDQQNYNAAAHPQFALGSGKTLISLSFNSPQVFQDFSLYRPRFYELNP